MNSGELTTAQLERIHKALAEVPFAKLVGIELEEIDSGVAILALEVRGELKQNNGLVHGGAIATLIDTAAAFAVISLLPVDEQASTVDLTVNYLLPLRSGRARAKARVVKAGRRVIVVSVDMTDRAGSLAATALTTYVRL
jgi:uncharacterized protein (TIGR00369 family)